MKKTDKLFELIQGMTMSEKRYFKVFATRHKIGEQNNYLNLFDLLDKMPEFDADELISEMERQSLNTKFVSADKNYLYKLILRTLSSFHTGKSNNLKVKEFLHHAEILYQKGLYAQCLNILEKAKKIAQKFELFPLLLEILHWERKVLESSADSRTVKRSFQKVSFIMEEINNLYEISNMHYQMGEMRQTITKARSPEAAEQLNLLMQHPFLQDEQYALSFTAKVKYWQTRAQYYYCIDDPEKELEAHESLISLMDGRPDYLTEYPFDYVSNYARLLALKRRTADDEFYPLLKNFHELPNQVDKAQEKIAGLVFLEANYSEMARLIELGRFEEAQRIIPKIKKGIKKHASLMKEAHKISFYYMFAYVQFANHCFHEALPFVNSILNEQDEEFRPEIYAATRMLNLILHFELGNYDLLKYISESTYRHLKKRQRLYKLEHHLLKFFKKLSQHVHEQKGGLMFRLLRNEVLGIFEDEYEKKALGYINILVWINRHIHDKTFNEAWKDAEEPVFFL